MIPATAFPKTRGVWADRCAVEVDVTAELDEMIQEIPSPMRQRRVKKDGLEGDCSLAPVQLEADSLASASPISASGTQRCYSKMMMLSLYEPSPKKISSIGAPPGLSLPDELQEHTPSFFPDSGSDVASVSEEDTPAEPSEPMKQVSTGDFVVATAWSSDETWEDEVALSVQEDELVYVSCVDAQGWAKAVAISGQGWLPAAVLRRQVYMVMVDYSGGPGYVKVEQGDQLTIYHREGEWAYGAVIGHSQVLEEGWFPCSVVNAQSS